MATFTLRSLGIAVTAGLLCGCGAYPIIGVGEGFDVEPVTSLVIPFTSERNNDSLNFLAHTILNARIHYRSRTWPQRDKWEGLFAEYRGFLDLREVDRIEGAWTVRATYLGTLLYEESFILESCD